ncbi:Ste24 endopeptidase [Virgisporangium aliadipatigenens]|uniref:Ste24 endopeptidase n=1 Tax=Virgisporangium aliadipatigenens TaxID=741659 RepID=A0A8J3YQH1_9ACTN|nr:M48 family metallopeptidase [Virgisporangium aliadipatigenens]GIJ49814.1 Ste24 endopeptidase [Virgisporangium aliadipatigenens]
MSTRVWAVATLGVLLVLIGIVAITRVPWSGAPAPRSEQLAALAGLPADAVAKGKAFNAALRPGSYGSMVIGLVVALVLGLTPFGARIVEAVGRPLGGHWLAQAVLGGLVIVLIGEVVSLPFAAWRHTVLKRYGLSTQDWGAWLVDLLKAYGVGAVLGALVLAGFFTITRLFPQWWWAVGAGAAAALVLVLTFVFPVLVEPVFNKFTPMEDGALRDSLVQLAERDGVPVKDVLVADASRRTRAVNAYVSGYGATRRIVVYDTLLREAPEAEVRSVVAHELSHARSNDVLTGTLLGALGSAAAVVLVYLLGAWEPLLRRAGVDSIAEPRAVALLMAIAIVGGLVAGPVQAYVSRKVEARSDAHALELTGDPETFQAMMTRLAMVNLADPDPNRVEHGLFGSHPSTVERLAMARAWAK